MCQGYGSRAKGHSFVVSSSQYVLSRKLDNFTFWLFVCGKGPWFKTNARHFLQEREKFLIFSEFLDGQMYS